MEQSGRAVPQSYKNAPDLFFDAVPLWEAFNALSSSRASGFGLGYIPYSEITSYLNDQCIDTLDERTYLRTMITFIDRLFVEIKSAEQERKSQSQKNKKK